jgi:hypothetical protein
MCAVLLRFRHYEEPYPDDKGPFIKAMSLFGYRAALPFRRRRDFELSNPFAYPVICVGRP